VRRIYPAENDPAALRVELAPRPGIAVPPDVAIVVVDDPKHGDEREAPVRVIMSQAQAARLIRMLRGVLVKKDDCGHEPPVYHIDFGNLQTGEIKRRVRYNQSAPAISTIHPVKS
jgi:hypothetical protein